MFQKLTLLSDRMVRRYLPDPFLFAVILTLFVFVLGVLLTPSSPREMANYWGEGFFDLLSFAMQMILIFVGGFVLAETPMFKRFIEVVVNRIKNPIQAVMWVAFISAVLCWVNWGLGLVLGAVLAKEVAKRVPGVDYRLLIAAAYSGFITFHAGISGSVPLLIATEGHFMEDIIGLIPTSETIFSPFNLILSITIMIALPVTFRFMSKYTKDEVYIDPSIFDEEEVPRENIEVTPANKLENNKIVTILIGALGLGYIIDHFIRNGFALDIEIVILVFIVLGIFSHRTPINFLNSVYRSISGVGGMVLQFPFYAGIMGMMVASGLALKMSEWLLVFSNEYTFAFLTFIGAGIVNVFVPSGGGQWAVQAHVILPAAAELGIAPAKAALAFLWGDVWTNLIQPFWALPALAIAGLKARDIMGFCLIVFVVTGIILGVSMFIL